MSSSLGVSLPARRLTDFAVAAFSRGLSAYQREFCALLSPSVLAWLLDRGERQLVLRATGEGGRLEFADQGAEALDPPITTEELKDKTLAEALARRNTPREMLKLHLEMPRDWFFVRRFDIPAAAESSVPKLLVADIERKTPFRLGEIVYGHKLVRNPGSPGKCSVELWILRRDFISRTLAGSGVAIDDVDFVLPSPQSSGVGLDPAIALSARAENPSWLRNLALGLVALTLVLCAIGIGATLWRQNRALDRLDAKIAEVSARAANVRKLADQAVAESRLLQILREERAKTPTFAELWEETSRILPDGAFLTELRLAETKSGERTLDMNGFADSAVRLPILFEKSPLLSEAALTAPITPHEEEKREAFSLRVKVKAAEGEAAK